MSSHKNILAKAFMLRQEGIPLAMANPPKRKILDETFQRQQKEKLPTRAGEVSAEVKPLTEEESKALRYTYTAGFIPHHSLLKKLSKSTHPKLCIYV